MFLLLYLYFKADLKAAQKNLIKGCARNSLVAQAFSNCDQMILGGNTVKKEEYKFHVNAPVETDYVH